MARSATTTGRVRARSPACVRCLAPSSCLLLTSLPLLLLTPAVHWPDGHIAVQAFTGDVVKLAPGATLTPGVFPKVVPATRDEVYYHHWTFNQWQVNASMFAQLAAEGGSPFDESDITIALRDAGQNTGMQGPCMGGLLHFRFGGGNELRGPAPGENYSYVMPSPYALESDAAEMGKDGLIWLVNSHLIDVRGVADFRGCTECQCNVTGGHAHTGNDYIGGLGCCHSTPVDGAKCPVRATVPVEEQTYFFQHTIKYKDWDASTDKHVEVVTLDVSDNGPAWSGFPTAEQFVPGHYSEAHTALKADPMAVASLATKHSGVSPSERMCHVEYYVPPCDPATNPRCEHVFNNSWGKASTCPAACRRPYNSAAYCADRSSSPAPLAPHHPCCSHAVPRRDCRLLLALPLRRAQPEHLYQGRAGVHQRAELRRAGAHRVHPALPAGAAVHGSGLRQAPRAAGQGRPDQRRDDLRSGQQATLRCHGLLRADDPPHGLR